MKVTLHQIEHDVDILEVVCVARRLEDVSNCDNVVVFEVLQDLDLAIRSLRDDVMLENVRDLLDRDLNKKFIISLRLPEMNDTQHSSAHARTLSFDFVLMAEQTTP